MHGLMREGGQGLLSTLPSLRGSLGAPIYIDDNVIALPRKLNAQAAITMSNNASVAKTIEIKLPAYMHELQFADALSGEVFKASNGALKITVPSLFGIVLISK